MVKKKIILVDTDILIKVFRGNAEHKKKLESISGRIVVSIITVLELYQGIPSKKYKLALEKQLKAYDIAYIDDRTSILSWNLQKKYALKNKLLPADCLIAATALKNDFILFTDNKKDYEFIEGITFLKT